MHQKQPEEVGTESDEGNKEGDSSAGGFQVVFESCFLLLILLTTPDLTFQSDVSKFKSYSGFGFMILYFSISGIAWQGIPSEVMQIKATFSL